MNHNRLGQMGRRLRDWLVVLSGLFGWLGIVTDAHGQGFTFSNPPGYAPAPGMGPGYAPPGYGGSVYGPGYEYAPGSGYGLNTGSGATAPPTPTSPWTGFNSFGGGRATVSLRGTTAASPWGTITGVPGNPPPLTSGPLSYSNTYRDNKVILPGGYYTMSNGQWYFVKTNTAPPYKWSRNEFNDRVAPPRFSLVRSQPTLAPPTATTPANRSASPTTPPRGVIPPTPPTTTTISASTPVTRPASGSSPARNATTPNARRATMPPLPAVSTPTPARPASSPSPTIR